MNGTELEYHNSFIKLNHVYFPIKLFETTTTASRALSYRALSHRFQNVAILLYIYILVLLKTSRKPAQLLRCATIYKRSSSVADRSGVLRVIE